MAIVTPARRPINRVETDRRVRHPLQALRGYIRTYVALEGSAVGVLFLAVWFWVGLFLDYGTFSVFGFDWLKRLTQAAGAQTAFWMQVFVLVILVIGLLGMVTMKVLLRLFREFGDAALALVLERRYPRELGDRLITAVEMADPKVAQKYGFSQTMIDQTISDAADRVERVPVREVFNWTRLYWQGALAVLATIGMYLAVGVGYCAVHQVGPGNYFWEFNHVAGIWCERNALLQDTYWPPHAYLELIRFPESERYPGEMRVARDENRPDVGIRAVRTIVFDKKGPEAPEGIRALRVADLPKLLTADVLDIGLPVEFADWVIDLDDLDLRAPAGALPAEWLGQGKDKWEGKTSRYLRAQMQDPEIRKLLSKDAVAALEEVLDWRTWTWDNVELQLAREPVREALQRDHPKAYEALEKIGTDLAELIDTPSMRRTIRQLTVPDAVQVQMRGKITWYEPQRPRRLESTLKYAFPLKELKESVTFSVCAEDYCTPSKKITLLPPPNVARLTMDKEDPAYLYYRVLGEEQTLKGLRQHFRGVVVSTTGPNSLIEVPLGTNLTVNATVDRDLKQTKSEDGKLKPDLVDIEPPEKEKQIDKNALTPRLKLEPIDNRGFSVPFPNVRRRIEFYFVFRDEDNVMGRRHIIIQPVADKDPIVVVENATLDTFLRREGFDPGKSASRGKDRFLITPDAYLPIPGRCEDDHGLVAVEWLYELKELDLKGRDDKEVEMTDPTQSPTVRRAGLLVWAMQQAPFGPGLDWISPAYITWLVKGAGLERDKHVDRGVVAQESFRAQYAQPLSSDVTREELALLLKIQPNNRRLLADLLENQKFDPFVKQLAESGQSDSFFGELIHLANVPEQDVADWRAKVRKEPADALRDLHQLLLNSTKKRGDDWIVMLKKEPHKALIKSHVLSSNERHSFDVKKQLPTVKVRDESQQAPHELSLYVQAIDNNIEANRPGTGRNKTGMVFMIVSEDELLFEINKEEQVMAKQIKDTLEELEAHKTLFDVEFYKAKPALGKLDMALAISDGLYNSLRTRIGTARGVHKAYARIVQEMLVNRIKEDRRTKVEFSIFVPLGRLVDPGAGDFAVTERTAQKLLRALEADQAILRKAAKEKNVDLEASVEQKLDEHWKNGRKAHMELTQLVMSLRQILHAMEEIGSEDELRNRLMAILRQQREAEQRLQEHYFRLLRDLIGEGAKN